MTATELKSRTVKDLALMAKKKKVPGWQSMKKDALIKALLQQAKADSRRHKAKTNGQEKPTLADRKIPERIEEIKTQLADAKDLTFRSLVDEETQVKDRLVVMVRDPYWLHAYWEISRKSVERAKVALGPYWHIAKPIIRVYEVQRECTTMSIRQPVRDVYIHGGVKNWYIDVQNPPKTYQLDLGYVTPDKRFFCLARSNVVSTPPVDNGDNFDKNWSDIAKEFDRVFALSGGYSEPEANGDLKDVLEERLQRPLGDPTVTQFGLGAAAIFNEEEDFNIQIDTELIVHGTTSPDAYVTLCGEPVKIRSDGSFAVRFNLSDRRHVLPIVASSRNGSQQRTIILAVDRNTKVMEPMEREAGE